MQSEAPGTAVFYKWLGWFEEHRQSVLYGAVAVTVVGLIVAFIIWRSGEKQKDAGYALARAFVPQATGSAERVPASNFLAVASQFPGSEAAGPAMLLGATSLFDSGKYAEAQAEFDKFARQYRDSSFVAEAQLGVAASLEAQGKTNEAVTAYKNLVDRRPSEVVVPQAKYALARLYDAQGKPELAYPLYEEVAQRPGTMMGTYAGFRAEELLAKYPNLAPAPPTAATSVSPLMLTNAPLPPTSTVTTAAPPVVDTNAVLRALSNALAPPPRK